MCINKKRGLNDLFFYLSSDSLGAEVFLKSMADKPAPNPIRIQTIRRNNCAPEAMGALNISSKVI